MVGDGWKKWHRAFMVPPRQYQRARDLPPSLLPAVCYLHKLRRRIDVHTFNTFCRRITAAHQRPVTASSAAIPTLCRPALPYHAGPRLFSAAPVSPACSFNMPILHRTDAPAPLCLTIHNTALFLTSYGSFDNRASTPTARAGLRHDSLVALFYTVDLRATRTAAPHIVTISLAPYDTSPAKHSTTQQRAPAL